MKGLILKDIYAVKGMAAQVLVMMAAFGIAFAGSADGSAIVMCVFGCTICIMSTLSLDESYEWNKFAFAMPVTRRQLVVAKYLAAVLFALFGLAVGVAMTVAVGLTGLGAGMTPLSVIGVTSGAGLAVALVLSSLMIPLSFRFGVNKGRYAFMAVAALIAAGAVVLAKSNLLPSNTMYYGVLVTGHNVVIGVALMVIALYLLSMLISIRIVEKKEF